MKGSPMQRNFGIGSPLHDERKPLKADLETEGDMPVKKGAKVTFAQLKRGAKDKLVKAKEKETSKRTMTDKTKMKPPYKKPVGPIAEKKKVKKEEDNVPLSPGYEDPIKIQKLQREGLTPGSQKFKNK